MAKTPQQDWDARFFCVAQEVATWSRDPDEQVGAVVVSPDKRRVSWGYNGLPAGFEELLPGGVILDKEAKNRHSLHAEDNAIAQGRGDVSGWTLYTTKAPCMACALTIHRAGIERVVCAPVRADSRWAQDQSDALAFLGHMGVSVSTIELNRGG